MAVRNEYRFFSNQQTFKFAEGHGTGAPCFAEPLIGITEYVSTEKRIHGYFWRSQWEEDSFLMRGDSTNE